MAVGLAAGAMVVACLSWSMLGYLLAWKMGLSLGMILPPLVAGCLGGLIMRYGRGFYGQKTGWVAVGFVLVGCIAGDVIWIMLAEQKTLGVLFGAELTKTVNAMTSLFKLVMHAVACYLAYSISSPPRVATAD